MRKKTKDKLLTLTCILLEYIIPILLVLGFIGLEIYCWVTYGNTPISETPSWVQWIMFRRG